MLITRGIQPTDVLIWNAWVIGGLSESERQELGVAVGRLRSDKIDRLHQEMIALKNWLLQIVGNIDLDGDATAMVNRRTLLLDYARRLRGINQEARGNWGLTPSAEGNVRQQIRTAEAYFRGLENRLRNVRNLRARVEGNIASGTSLAQALNLENRTRTVVAPGAEADAPGAVRGGRNAFNAEAQAQLRLQVEARRYRINTDGRSSAELQDLIAQAQATEAEAEEQARLAQIEANAQAVAALIANGALDPDLN
jgi:hypothetical protein